MPEQVSDWGTLEEYRSHAAFRAAQSPSGIGAAVERDESDAVRDGRRWAVIVTDRGGAWHYLRVDAPGLRRGVDPDDVESAIEAYAAELPERGRLAELMRRNPLVFDGSRARPA
jgi:hypothetical protein